MTQAARRRVDVEDIYRLTPLQEGMLFHTLYAPGSGVYFEQTSVTFGAIDVDVLRRAWQRTLRRHPILRTGFVWKGVSRPVQLVRRDVEMPIEVHDWSGLPEAERPARLAAYLAADRSRGFALDRPPLVRLAVFRLGPDAVHVVWSHHHILLDGWSVALLQQEVLQTYLAGLDGREPELAPARPFRDYVAWLDRQDLAGAEAYWRGQLGDLTSPTSLRLPPPREPGPGHEEHLLLLDREATARLGHWARDSGVTLNTVVHGAWAILLGWYSGERDVLFGSTSSGRGAGVDGIETMVGLFLNTLPARVRIDAGASLTTWLQGLQARLAAARAHEYVHLVDAHRWSGLQAGQPLFETIVVYESYPSDRTAWRESGATLREQRVMETTNYPLTLLVSPGDRLGFNAVVERERFDGASVERMLGHLRTLLEAVPDHASRPLGDLGLLTSTERRRLAAWNSTASDLPEQACVTDLVAAQARRTPDAVAVQLGEQTVGYRELDDSANRLARHLVRLGVRPEEPVGLCLQPSFDLLTALLGTLKAGAAYVPLDPSYPAERLGYMARDSGLRVLVTHDAADTRPAAPVTVCLDRDRAAIEREPSGAPAAGRCRPGGLAYVIYTSGSTGRPKGVEVTHRALLNFLLAMVGTLRLDAADAVLALTSLSFDIAALEVYAPLLVGARVVVAPRPVAVDPPRLGRLIDESAVTVVQATPSAWQMLLDGGWAGSRRLTALSGGEALAPALARELTRRAAAVWNLYGPTETAVWSAAAPVPAGAAEITIGRPVANTRLHVLDAELRPVGAGMVGELCIAGEGVARGYRNRPDLTAGRFVPEPGPAPSGARMYMTGDLARWRPDGTVDLLGRADRQVKVRGHRVELGEVEAVLREHPAVREAAVVARGDQAGGQRLVAYVVPAAGAAPGSAELREFLGARLPEPMLPLFVGLERLPLTPNGKVDRGALPAPEDLRPAGPSTPPTTPTELALAELWLAALGVKEVGVHDDYFELGGHSLIAVRLVSRICDRFAIDLPLRALFEAPTIARLAARIDGGAGAGRASPVVELRAGGSLPPLFLVHPSGGEVYCYYELAGHLAEEQPVYGLAAFDGADPDTLTVEDMASGYVGAVRERQPHGPYFIGGWSLGAVVAYEMAQQLRTAGEEVALLAMIDEGPPAGALPDPVRDDIDAVASLFPAPRSDTVRELLDGSEALRRLGPDERLLHIRDQLAAAGFVPADAPVDRFRRLHRGFRARKLAVSRYAARPYDGPLTLFRAADREDAPAAADDAYGWRELCDVPVQVVDVPGSHDTVVTEPCVRVLAAELQRCLHERRVNLPSDAGSVRW